MSRFASGPVRANKPIKAGRSLFLEEKLFKRLTDCHKWNDPWFRKLPVEYKLLWNYICDGCDNSGVWKVDMETASFFIGNPVNEETALAYLNTRIIVLDNGYWLVKKFLEFQYGILTESCPPHKAVLKLIQKHTLTLPYPYPSIRVQDKDKDKDVVDVREGMGGIKKSKVMEWFEKLWINYPKERRVGKSASLKSFSKRVKTLEDALWVGSALHNYLKSKTVSDGFIKNASTFFANVEDYADERRDQPGPIIPPFERRPDQQSPGIRGLAPATRIVSQFTNNEFTGNKSKTESP